MRSNCPVSYALDIFGDKWTFLVIRDLVEGKRYYKEFLSSPEGIATNILSDRLKRLCQYGIVVSGRCKEIKTQKEYTLTEKGKNLIPILVEIMVWSNKYGPSLDLPANFIQSATQDRNQLIKRIRSRLD